MTSAPRKHQPRLAAGRARALGLPTRGTTNPNRLRRMDNWITAVLAPALRAATGPPPPAAPPAATPSSLGAPPSSSAGKPPLAVDLGYGVTPITAIELAARLRRVRPDVRVLGLELDPARVAAAQFAADPPRLEFARGGFELAGRRPALVRAANVLRQYDEPAARRAWDTLRGGLAPGGLIVEGTCDEIGRLAGWVLLDASGPVSLTLACRVESLARPADLAERLPKALIHHNVPGEPIHALLRDLDRAWDTAAPLTAFGPRQRWIAACAAVAGQWPVLTAERARFGELTVPWSAVAPG